MVGSDCGASECEAVAVADEVAVDAAEEVAGPPPADGGVL